MSTTSDEKRVIPSSIDKDEETLKTWNEIAQMYFDRFVEMSLYNPTYDLFLEKLFVLASGEDKPLRVLDIGCGPGVVGKYALNKCEEKSQSIEFVGIDAAPNMITLAQKHFPQSDWMIMDCRDVLQLVESQKPFHGAVIGFCIPYLNEMEVVKLLSDSFALMYEEGILYLSFVAGSPDKSEYKTSKSGRVYFHYYEEQQIRDMLTATGFHDIVRMEVDFPRPENQIEVHTIFIAQKRKHIV